MMELQDKKCASATLGEVEEEKPVVEDISWTEDEEKRLRGKVDRLVMPLLMLAFFALALDRGNIGNALTNDFMEDVGITQSQFNIGIQMLCLGIVLWEIPSNLVLHRIGPALWLSGQIVCWGLVATFQAFQHGFGAYIATRFILGSCESGLVPASLYTITRWYKNEETSKRFSMFYLGSLIMYALGGDIAYGILHMDNVVGLHGWQWLFMIEGAITVCAGIVFVVFFPSSPAHPVSVVGIRYFDERESQILVQRVCRDDPTKRPRARNITMAEVKSTVTNWRLIPHVLMALCGLSPLSAFGAYGPTLIASWGYDLLESNAWMSIGPWCAVVVSICLGFTADKTGLRGPWVLFGGFFWWLFLLVTRIILFNPNGHIRFAVLTAAFSFALVWHPINASWMALNARSPGERSITMAVYIMSANASGIMGSQFFQASDGPIYEHAFTTILALVSLALVAMVFANLQYFLLNRRANKKGSEIRYQQ